MTCMLARQGECQRECHHATLPLLGSAFDYVFVVLHRRAVDFGAGWWAPESAFGQQRALNAPGKSPPFCSEF